MFLPFLFAAYSDLKFSVTTGGYDCWPRHSTVFSLSLILKRMQCRLKLAKAALRSVLPDGLSNKRIQTMQVESGGVMTWLDSVLFVAANDELDDFS